ncbi:AraC family transcriptional regulator [Micromonospora sp. WMMC250]|uniref:AraC family transcriptional regulator n=1 Tax=Micromonospora sp. WMMC250 TaxID=3014781 RepID=UPI0022B5E9F5|nr:AraC family transcriptional regulator [Micromonospora sp. WMMC250]MCZ7379877.1 AraC family transcriptional regulator [Micromonospora sp. WMMC250]
MTVSAHTPDDRPGPVPRQPWRGEALLRPGHLIYRGMLGPTGTHAHHAVQILAATTPVNLTDSADRAVNATAAVIPANAWHRITGNTALAVMAYLDPSTVAGQLAGRFDGDPADARRWARAGAHLAGAAGTLTDLPIAKMLPRLLHLLIPSGGHHRSSTPPAHPAVARAVADIERRLPNGTVRLDDVATAVGLSPDRLAHLLTAALGLPFRAYVRWRRLQIAIAHVAAGTTLTSAAHAAGFADSAHLTRTSHRTFGLAPSTLTGVHFLTDR